MARSTRKPLNVKIDADAILEKVGKMKPEKEVPPSPVIEKETTETPLSNTVPVNETENNISNMDIQLYSSTFLTKNQFQYGTKTIRLDLNTHELCIRFLNVLPHPEYPRLLIVDYVNNVLQDHMDKYGDKMNELYKKHVLTSLKEILILGQNKTE